MTPNMRDTLVWLRAEGFIVGRAPLDCGHPPTVRDPDSCSNGVAHLDGKRVCYACADVWLREHMKTARDVMLYLDGNRITSWSGGFMAQVTQRTTRTMRGFGGRYTRVYVRAVDQDGKHWHGTGPGDGMYIRLHATRVLPDPVATRSRGWSL